MSEGKHETQDHAAFCIPQCSVKAGAVHNQHTASKITWQGSGCSSQSREAQVPALSYTDPFRLAV